MYIQQDATLHSLFYLETDLHVSGGTTTHHQERKQLYLQHLVFVTPLLLSAAIVEELELVWVCCGWRTPPTAVENFVVKIPINRMLLQLLWMEISWNRIQWAAHAEHVGEIWKMCTETECENLTCKNDSEERRFRSENNIAIDIDE